jgi:hypothetical protein
MVDGAPRTSTTCYLAELSRSRHRPDRLGDERQRISDVVDAAAASGIRIRYLHTVFVPDEEPVFHVFEAADGPDAVAAVLHAAGLEADRISAAVTTADAVFAGQVGGEPAARLRL